MQEALEEARKAYRLGEVPIGAVLVKDDEILARSYNETILSNDPTAHAEILVLRRGAEVLKNYRLVNSTLYVTVEPCLMCAGAMIQARIERLVYGTDDLKSGAVRSLYKILNDNRFNHQVKVTFGILAEDCKKLLQSFFEKLR
jgi:tRNA(adenine34) deaminase